MFHNYAQRYQKRDFFDILTTDAYYSNKPFVLFLDSLGKYLVSRVKDERTTLYKEIDTLSQMVEPIHVDDRENRVESLIYEIPELSVFPRSRRSDNGAQLPPPPKCHLCTAADSVYGS